MKVFTFAPIIPTLDEVLTKGNKAGHDIIMDGTNLNLYKNNAYNGDIYAGKRSGSKGIVLNGLERLWIDIANNNYIEISPTQTKLDTDLDMNNNNIENILKAIFSDGGMNTSPDEKQIWFNNKIGCYAVTDAMKLRSGLGAYADIYMYDTVRHKYDFITPDETDQFSLVTINGMPRLQHIAHANGYMRLNLSTGSDEGLIISNNINMQFQGTLHGVFSCMARFGGVASTEYLIGLCTENGEFIAGLYVDGGSSYWRYGVWNGSTWTYTDISIPYGVLPGDVVSFYIIVDYARVAFVLSNGDKTALYQTNYTGDAYFYVYGRNISGSGQYVDIDYFASLCERF